MNEMRQDISFETRLDRLAEIAVHIGLNPIPGQQIILTAPAETLPLVRRIAAHAYKAGAGLVTPILTDDAVTLARYTHATDEPIFAQAPAWLYDSFAACWKAGGARLAIYGEDPALLSAQNPNHIATANKARALAYAPALDMVTSFSMNWSICAAATPGWARSVFPNLPPDQAMRQLWHAIFTACRVDTPDPVAAWRTHIAHLQSRCAQMNQARYHSLHFQAPGTDLTVGLAQGHQWLGGASATGQGVECAFNIPTEEIFTTPDATRTQGHARATKPLSYGGTMIENIEVRFEHGRITQMTASTGQEVFAKVLATDDGAPRLGEVALVPHRSAVADTGILFNATLFDENAASHIAVGNAYRTAVTNGTKMDPLMLDALGVNTSLIHIDWMIGSNEMDVDGLATDGSPAPVMRAGEWV